MAFFIVCTPLYFRHSFGAIEYIPMSREYNPAVSKNPAGVAARRQRRARLRKPSYLRSGTFLSFS